MTTSTADDRRNHVITDNDLTDRTILCVSTISTCQHLLVPNTTAAVATMTLHKFLDAKSSLEVLGYDVRVLLSAVVFMSCKLTETQRQFRDVFNVVSKVLDPAITAKNMDYRYCERKEQIIQLEQNILRTLNFNLEFDLPHKYMLNIARFMKFTQNIVRIAWCLLNDALLSRECVTTPPEVVACGCLLVAQKTVEKLIAFEQAATHSSLASDDTTSPSNTSTVNGSSESGGSGSGNGSDSRWWSVHLGLRDSDVLGVADWLCATKKASTWLSSRADAKEPPTASDTAITVSDSHPE